MNSDDTFMYMQGVSQGRDECEKEIAILKKRIEELESDLIEAHTETTFYRYGNGIDIQYKK